MTPAPRQLPLDLPHRPALDRADFLVAPANRAALAWLDRWPDWPGPALVVVGPPGSGKSHLAAVFAARSGAVMLAPKDLPGADPLALAEVGAVVLDDADRVDPPRPLLHLWNLLREAGGHLLLIASRPPARWGVGLRDLDSRLRTAPVATIEPPDDALFAAVLVKLFADRQLALDPAAVRYLVGHMERSFAAARRLAETADRLALAEKRPITLPLLRRALEPGLG
ncbi:HdaA/DnaA family protein [Roseospirillum parvum]|uniref:Hda lid domain-containing protein n=1 Tax=Roseospirillum parvum TaxID=83401 RepID=A0A1G7VY32_9PROT|nr:DNA replication protein [Roseospirillum parvum]SDG64349.1 hypothetical protein SAMN05421742_1021 [Roseospirillum parvum]